MRTFWILLLPLLLAGPAWGDEKADARALLEKALKAAGDEARALTPAATWKARGTYYGFSAEGLPVTVSGARQGPTHLRLATETTSGGLTFTRVLVLDGTKGWVKLGERTRELQGADLQEEQERLYVNWVASLVPLRDKAFELSLLAPAQVAGKEAVGLLVRQKGHRDVKLYFDKKSLLLVKREAAVKDLSAGGKQVREELVLSGHRRFAGAQHATHTEVYWDGKLISEMEVTEVKPAEKLDPAVFAKP